MNNSKFGIKMKEETIHYDNGNCYNGSVVKNQPHGFGSMNYVNGDRYEGVWSKGKRYGSGTLYLNNGKIKSGFWDNQLIIPFNQNSRVVEPGKDYITPNRSWIRIGNEYKYRDI